MQKKIIFIFGLFLSLLSIPACKSGCDKVVCKVSQVCKNGTCFCKDGYEGANCDVYSATKFIGNYTASQNCTPSGGNNIFYPTIQQYSSNVSELTIGNFIQGYQIVAYLRADAANSGTYMEIPEQQLTGTSSDVVSGNGTLSKTSSGFTQINVQVNYRLGGQDYACYQTWTKQ